MPLRDYQQWAIDSAFDYFGRASGNPLIQLPTGTGKSLVIGGFTKQTLMQWPDQRIMMLTHVKELIDQNLEKLLRMWPSAPAGVYSAGLKRRDTHHNILYAGIASVANCPDAFPPPNIIFIDEAHRANAAEETQYKRFIDAQRRRNPYLKVIGTSATCYRLGHGHLTEPGGLFTDVCFDGTSLEAFNWFLDQGWLCPLIPKRTYYGLDVSDVGLVGGEYNLRQLQEAVDKDSITKDALGEALACAGGRRHGLIFASGVHHAIRIAELLNAVGEPAVAVHSKMKADERDAAIRAFKAGHYRWAVNNNILTTGFDFPEIDVIVVLRPTQSPGLWVQMLGRGTRPVYAPGAPVDTAEQRRAAIQYSQKPNCLVLDFARNAERLGPINDPIMPRRKTKKGEGGTSAPIKVCENCFTYCHASVRFCPACGAEFIGAVHIATRAGTTELIKTSTPPEPKYELFPVSYVTFARHQKHPSKPASMKVTYYVNGGLHRFSEYICFEHRGMPRRKAEGWWLLRVDSSVEPFVPFTVNDALLRTSLLRPTKSITVWTNKDYPEIVSHDL